MSDHVDTLNGTGTVGEINNFPGASVPFGIVQYSPDTRRNLCRASYEPAVSNVVYFRIPG